jgi:hypothetical protein
MQNLPPKGPLTFTGEKDGESNIENGDIPVLCACRVLCTDDRKELHWDARRSDWLGRNGTAWSPL